MARDMWDMLSDLETQIVNVQTSLDLETLIVQKYDRINKDDREKLTDYEHIGTLTRVLFDRLYDEANALNAICAELFDAIHKQKSVAGGVWNNRLSRKNLADESLKIATKRAAWRVRGKARNTKGGTAYEQRNARRRTVERREAVDGLYSAGYVLGTVQASKSRKYESQRACAHYFQRVHRQAQGVG